MATESGSGAGRRWPWGRVLWLGLLVVSTGLVVWLVTFHLVQQRPVVPVGDLLVADPGLPESVAEVGSGSLDWMVVRTEDLELEGWTIRKWTIYDSPTDVSCHVCRYVKLAVRRSWSPIGAWWWFWRALYVGSPINDDFPPEAPMGWSYRSKGASEETIGCVHGRIRHYDGKSWCGGWLYAARYGQYEVYVSFFSPYEGITLEDFERVVESIEPQVADAL